MAMEEFNDPEIHQQVQTELCKGIQRIGIPALFVLASSLVDYLISAVAPSMFKIPALDKERGAPQEVLDERYDTVSVIICGLLPWQNGKNVV